MSAINVAGWLMIVALFAGIYRLYGITWIEALKYAVLTLGAMAVATGALYLAVLP